LPRITSVLPKSVQLPRFARRPSKLTFGTAAATILAAAGVAAGIAAGATPGSGSTNGLAGAADIGRAGASHAGALVVGAARAPHARTQSDAARRLSQAPARRLSHAARSAHSAKPAAAKQAPARRRDHDPKRNYLIYDSVTPSAIPAHHAVATYATGNYAVTPAQVAGRRTVLWIDTNGSDPNASILDVEPGDATPAGAAAWARARLTAHPHALARIYTMLSEWGATKAAIGTLPPRMRAHVRWWIADPTGYPHLVPGSDATQWYWGHNFDKSTATPRF
jgi:hypothetical protein